MWGLIIERLEKYPQGLKVARVLIENGLSIKNGKIFCNNLLISPTSVARVAGVDRRTVSNTIKTIQRDNELRTIFEGIRNAGHSLKEVAKHLGMGVVEITPVDARTPGILANSAILLSDRNISIRQAIVDDPELSPEPKLTLLTEKQIPGDLLQEFLKIKGVAKVTVY
ncbi:MAG: amino acid-binding protein [Thermoproteota archaeon]|nr:amino acid-binding protein [Candidatus Bathyarchaeota archaeon]